MGSNTPGANSPRSNFFRGCTVTIICLFLIILGVIIAITCAIFASAFWGTLILYLVTVGSIIVPVILWLIDKTNPRVDDWLKKGDKFLENLWNKLTGSAPSGVSRSKISQVTIRLCAIVLLLLASIVGSIIDPAVPQFIHDQLFHVCGVCVDPKTGVGISDGQYHFLANPPDNLKQFVDVEKLIYSQDQQIIQANQHHITIVVVTTLAQDGKHIGIGYDDLQAAFVLQNEANLPNTCRFQDYGGCLHIRLLIANAGDNMEYAPTIAQQIIQIASSDHTFIGTIGWPLSRSESIDGVRTLTSHNILAISSTASSDTLTAISPYFFRVAPVDSEQGPVDAQYAVSLGAHNAAVFYTPDNPYSLTLATSFIQTFIKRPGNHFLSETYSTSSNSTDDQRNKAIYDGLTAALLNRPDPADLIYFPGYSDDFNKLLTMLRNTPEFQQYSSLPIISGDGAYDIHSYIGPNYQNFVFTAFASPDEWGKFPDLCAMDAKRPAVVRDFFCDYARDFDPQTPHPGTYGFSRADSPVILTYDAATILVQGYLAVRSSNPTEEAIQHAIQGFNVCYPQQGVSGQIAFGPDNNPVNKSIVLLKVDYVSQDKTGHTIFRSILQGQLWVTRSQGC